MLNYKAVLFVIIKFDTLRRFHIAHVTRPKYSKVANRWLKSAVLIFVVVIVGHYCHVTALHVAPGLNAVGP